MATRLEAIPLWTAHVLDNDDEVESAAIMCTRGDPEYLMIRVVSEAGDANVRIGYKISGDGTTFNTVLNQDALVTATATEFASPKTPEAWHVIPCPGAPWIQIVVTEISAANLTDTVLDAVLWMRNDVAEMR